jgi:hypothetical protein
MRGSPTAELFFDNVEIPEGALPLPADFTSMPWRQENTRLTDRERTWKSRWRSRRPHVGPGPGKARPQWWTIRVGLPPCLFYTEGITTDDHRIMQAALDLTLEYTHTREQFNKKIGTFQLMQGKLAGKLMTIHMLR